MARLRFVPKAGMCVAYPGRGAGDYHFAGRHFDAETMANVADADPIDVLAGTAEADRFIQITQRDGDLHPFDADTAKACGVRFVPMAKGADGEWMPATKSAPVAQKAE